ncbi:MAG TPA: PLP-dependent transferase [Hungateiclostridium thermocellum]|jgi:cystathionine gamma-synthase|uniref:Cys/Met metabolism pyridoxal-phosphate-dependent protein n=2 Tax=Acetivibrio thermocellus TaxID=1515 RepID=A3DJ69_ACET2|nr:PLP-dependent aspartate aminotransferase family protein [Acetivibrio thermocellus]CDG37319.1 Cystathionine gamma-lyase [Acetivibrio thermocellus BC1]ABN53998.1 Cys/Met metabolism pyridoxal-phosphate-dependent protein [Acetivibrio thermocellus ATCC 27405]ADU73478.1 Cys/Met metabolism pyridoxal-phosphate-dependent protein [Acetivibrio thermocellus DSM 1313]ALX07400.1 Cystathionine gamma-lyase [Acetivibrio thermocellus AD2]ANV75139.1 Cystathionine gamma-lyase [Acetivibrio thermocellus DSM 2360
MMKVGNVSNYSISTKVVHGSKCYDPHTGAVSFPIYQSATFRHPALYQTTGYDYSRLQNPTREELENTIANIENGKFGFAFSSGMAAVSTILSLFSPKDHIIVSDDLYGGTYRLFEEIYKKYGLEFSYVNTSRIQDIEEAVKENTKAFFIETPTNPMMKVADLKTISRFAKDRKILLIVDNTFLTPYFQRPLELGADIVVHSGTKYLGGHNDTLAGLVVVNDEELAERIKLIQKSEGAVLSPFDSWLILRGIKTLGVRLEKQQENAMKIAKWLCTHKNVTKVNYVGLPDHEGYEISKSQASGFGAMISFNVKDVQTVEKVLSKVQLVMFAESLGGVESLITYPAVQTHAAIPEEMRNRIGVTDTLLRLSVGIEDADDIIADLEQALE